MESQEGLFHVELHFVLLNNSFHVLLIIQVHFELQHIFYLSKLPKQEKLNSSESKLRQQNKFRPTKEGPSAIRLGHSEEGEPKKKKRGGRREGKTKGSLLKPWREYNGKGNQATSEVDGWEGNVLLPWPSF